jgi:hypothetical protein
MNKYVLASKNAILSARSRGCEMARNRSQIRIVAVPPGQAPLWVRESWVGLKLPVHRDLTARKRLTVGVLDRPSLISLLCNLIRGRAEFTTGYAVEALRAVEILDDTNPDAAAWWRQNTPHLLVRNRYFLFPTEVCEKIDF